LLPAVIRYTVPIILTSILQLLFNAADLVVVGRFCGPDSVAAVGNTGALTALIINLFVGISVGIGVAVAQGLGAKNGETVHRAVHTALPAAFVGSAVLTVVGVTFCQTFLTWMGTPTDVLPLSATYMRIYFGGITFTLVYNFCAAILRAAGDTKSPLIFLTIAGVVNVLLNLVFVIVLDMNVAGVALATTISQGISAVLVVWALMRRTDECKLYLRKMRFYKDQLIKAITIGLPAGLQGSLFSISNVMIQSSINSFDDKVLMAGNAAASNIESFLFVAMNSFHQTALNFTGQNVGAGNYRRVKQVMLTCLGCVAVLGTVIGVGCYGFAPYLLRIYVPDSPDAIAWGITRMSFIFMPYALCGLMDVSTGCLRGMGVSITPTFISVIGICGIRVGWILTLFQWEQFHTPESLYISYPISWTVTFIGQFLLFWGIYHRRRKRFG
jgi:putative MATE family efflux protein